MDKFHPSFLLSEERKKIENPEKYIPFLVSKNDVVAELGCGPGFYCQYLVKYAKQVYCVDKRKEMIEIAKKIAKNAIFLVEDASHTSIPSSSVDIVLFSNSFHDMDKKEKVKEEVKRILNKEGRVIIIDWKKENTPFGPPLSIRMSKEDYIKEFSPCFKLLKEFEVGPYHFGLVLQLNP
ncbi:methyltransferase domain-containing protein [Acidianus sulfidivorans JP7]|uniref:Class I SAM-dependent methyltransferase n=1 Tax=Acidianus sulfidivorans JP7 TaxID=619593 RepID=A0A2U9IJZ3_9CREN|nr:class I SAM-dependent methyltransferase [Acidianus sulfidivorans]AWR96286.1 methyltransferase domain-containing protein [Acidianus sulfidivorans JP7]